MIKISRSERDALDKAGLLKPKRKLSNGGFDDSNFMVVNKTHNGKAKHYYIAETPDVLLFLERYDNMNLQSIRQDQLQILLDKNIIKQSNIQVAGEYRPGATVFIDRNGKIRCKKITEYMFAMNIWKKQ